MALFHSLEQEVMSRLLRRQALCSPLASDLYLHLWLWEHDFKSVPQLPGQIQSLQQQRVFLQLVMSRSEGIPMVLLRLRVGLKVFLQPGRDGAATPQTHKDWVSPSMRRLWTRVCDGP